MYSFVYSKWPKRAVHQGTYRFYVVELLRPADMRKLTRQQRASYERLLRTWITKHAGTPAQLNKYYTGVAYNRQVLANLRRRLAEI